MSKSKETKLPYVIRHFPAIVLLRGDDIWWASRFLSMRGLPPPGLPIAMETPVRVDPLWGPPGEPQQVNAGPLYADDQVALVDRRGGQTGLSLNTRLLRYVADGARGEMTLFLHRFETEGEPAATVAAYRRVHSLVAQPDPKEVMRAYMAGEELPSLETASGFELFAIMAPLREDPAYWQTEIDTMLLPRMRGMEIPEEALHGNQ